MQISLADPGDGGDSDNTQSEGKTTQGEATSLSNCRWPIFAIWRFWICLHILGKSRFSWCYFIMSLITATLEIQPIQVRDSNTLRLSKIYVVSERYQARAWGRRERGTSNPFCGLSCMHFYMNLINLKQLPPCERISRTEISSKSSLCH